MAGARSRTRERLTCVVELVGRFYPVLLKSLSLKRRKRRAALLGLAVCFMECLGSATDTASVKLRLENNQPFPIKMPIVVRGPGLSGDSWVTTDGGAAQRAGTNLVLLAQI